MESAEHLLARGQQAMQHGDLADARESFEQAIEMEPIPVAHDALAKLAFLRDDFHGARRHWETAHKQFRQVGDLRGAALAAVDLAATHYDAFLNESAAQGWLARAERLLDQVGHCVERGYLALALVACDVRNADALEQSAEFALEVAMEFGDRDLEARALADGGLALINKGQITKGFARLDEAMAAVSADEVSPIVCGKIFCAMMSACERVGDLRRAEEWTRVCDAFLDTTGPSRFPILQSHCRATYGSVLCNIGRWSDGETEILQALAPTSTTANVIHAEAVAALAGLRLMQGRLEEAAELLEPYADRFEVCEKLARLHHMRGEHDLAVPVILRGLGDLVGDRLRAGQLLDLLIEVELARGNVDAAARTLEQLAASADESDSTVLKATAKLAEARIAKHRSAWGATVSALSDAVNVLGDEERPILNGRIRAELAVALKEVGDDAGAITEGRGALAIFERLGADRDADQVAALLRELGAPGRSRPRDREATVASLTAREKDVFALLGEGLTNAEIAQRLFITPKTAEHHVGRVLSKLGVRSRTEVAAIAAAASTR